jgi:hypothetical protein
MAPPLNPGDDLHPEPHPLLLTALEKMPVRSEDRFSPIPVGGPRRRDT